MDPSKFYHQFRYIRTIPEGSSDSELSDIVENCEFSQLLPDIESKNMAQTNFWCIVCHIWHKLNFDQL